MFQGNAKAESSKAQLAAASAGAIAARYASRIDDHNAWQVAMEEIQDCLAEYRIPADQIAEVLSQAAARYITPDATTVNGPQTLQLLIDAGADLSRAQTIWAERRAKLRIQIGDARL